MPLSHITDRHHVYVSIYNGGRVGVVYDSSKLMDSLRLVRPTILFGAPVRCLSLSPRVTLSQTPNIGCFRYGKRYLS